MSWLQSIPKRNRTTTTTAAATTSSSSSSSSSERTEAPPPPSTTSTSKSKPIYTSDACAICLKEPPENVAFLDPCFHSYCFDCILRYIAQHLGNRINNDCLLIGDQIRQQQQQQQQRCPICRRGFINVIHNIHGDCVYDILRLDDLASFNQLWTRSASFSATNQDRIDGPAAPRWARVYGLGRRSRPLPSTVSANVNNNNNNNNNDNNQPEEAERGGGGGGGAVRNAKSSRYIVIHGNSETSVTRDRLLPWIKRELTFLLRGTRDIEECVDLIADLVIRSIIGLGKTKAQAMTEISPWLRSTTAELFLHELRLFCASSYNADTYEDLVTRSAVAAEEEEEEGEGEEEEEEGEV